MEAWKRIHLTRYNVPSLVSVLAILSPQTRFNFSALLKVLTLLNALLIYYPSENPVQDGGGSHDLNMPHIPGTHQTRCP